MGFSFLDMICRDKIEICIDIFIRFNEINPLNYSMGLAEVAPKRMECYNISSLWYVVIYFFLAYLVLLPYFSTFFCPNFLIFSKYSLVLGLPVINYIVL